MEIKETYRFFPRDYDRAGRRKFDGVPFREVLKEFEYDFHVRHPDCYAQFMLANIGVMSILARSCNANANMIYGIELIDGEFDIDFNFIMEEASDRSNVVVYAIDSAYMTYDESGLPIIDDIFPLGLVVDGDLGEGVLQLQGSDDDDSDDESLTTKPVNIDMITA